ncbi:MAG: hypothetical protein ACI8X5_001118 [Planctomycetota bacterium]|jgi:hypothetical protein
MLRFLPILFSCVLLAACVAPDSGSGADGSEKPGSPGRVTFIDYSDFVRLNLVNVAHSDPVEFYSEIRTSASTKITYDEVFEAMLDYFENEGFNDFASQGFAPRSASQGAMQALEVETEAGTSFLVYGKQATEKERAAFRQCVMAWQEVFNRTQQAQAVSSSTSGSMFGTSQAGSANPRR